MACHESVVQKRRKNRNKLKQQDASGRDKNKKLPELPPPKADMLHSAYAPESAIASPEKFMDPEQSLDRDRGQGRDTTGKSPQERSPSRPQTQGDYDVAES